MMPPMPPSFSTWASWSRQILEIELAPCASSRPSSWPSRRRSIPRPSRPARRCRPCRGCGWRCGTGWKSSSASIFSPVPSSLIGLPVTARIDSAAPPRPSPSMRVSTMPVMPTRSSKLLARLTASWPVRLSATSRISCGPATALDLGHLGHQRLVDMGAAGRVEHDDVVALQARRLLGPAWRSAPASVPPRWAAYRRRPGGPGRRAAPARRGASRRARPSARLRFCRSARRLAILAVVVVLPAPCRPTIMMATGAGGVEVDRLGVGAERLDQHVR